MAVGVLRERPHRYRGRSCSDFCSWMSNAQTQPGRFDLAGFLLAASGLGLVMYGVSEGPLKGWEDKAVLGTLVTGAMLLAALVIVELRSQRAHGRPPDVREPSLPLCEWGHDPRVDRVPRPAVHDRSVLPGRTPPVGSPVRAQHVSRSTSASSSAPNS